MAGKYYAVLGTLDVNPENESRLIERFGTYGKLEPRYNHGGKRYMLLTTTRWGENDAKDHAREYMKSGDFVEVLYVCEGGERQRDADD